MSIKGLGYVVVFVFWTILFIWINRYRWYLYDLNDQNHGLFLLDGSDEMHEAYYMGYIHALLAGFFVSLCGWYNVWDAQSISALIFFLLLLLVGFGIGGMIAVSLLRNPFGTQSSWTLWDRAQVRPEPDEYIDISQIVDLTHVRALFKEDFDILLLKLDSAFKHCCLRHPNNSGLTGEEFVENLELIEDYTKSIDLPVSAEDTLYVFKCLKGLINLAYQIG